MRERVSLVAFPRKQEGVLHSICSIVTISLASLLVLRERKGCRQYARNSELKPVHGRNEKGAEYNLNDCND